MKKIDMKIKNNFIFPFWFNIIFTIAVIIFIILASSFLGTANLAFTDVLNVLKFKIFGIENNSLEMSSIFIVWNLRIPRALLALAVGGGLSIAGCAMQSITQNILADPYLLGVSSGASAAVSIAFFIGLPITFGNLGLPFVAFLGALLAMLFVYSLGMVGNSTSSTRLVLAGIAVSVVLGAITQLFMILAPSDKILRSLVEWMMGSIAAARWHNILIPILTSFICSAIFLVFSKAFNVISLGNEIAITLGIDLNKIKKITAIVTALLTGVLVSACGIIGFVGFIIPHIVRFLVGADHRKLFPMSFLIGGLFLLCIDLLARLIMAPREMPVGIFTALCGGPFFIWLLRKQKT